MKFRTEIEKTESPFKINHCTKIVMYGSCFSDSISKKLKRYKFSVNSNPFGTIYNPYSISKIIHRVANENIPKKDEFVKKNDIWHHFDLHGNNSGIDLDELVLKIKSNFIKAKKNLEEAEFVFITLGTSIVYTRKDTGEIVANNHKFPSDFFVKKRLGQDEIIKSLQSTIKIISSLKPDIKIFFTISPVRHKKDGLIENNRSKAALILAVDKLVDNKKTFYFPAYELLIDDLRDYRFYSNDLVHPSDLAIDYIWNSFSETFFDENTIIVNKKIEKINKSLEHKPLFEKSKETQHFYSSLRDKIEKFNKEHPSIKFDLTF